MEKTPKRFTQADIGKRVSVDGQTEFVQRLASIAVRGRVWIRWEDGSTGMWPVEEVEIIEEPK